MTLQQFEAARNILAGTENDRFYLSDLEIYKDNPAQALMYILKNTLHYPLPEKAKPLIAEIIEIAKNEVRATLDVTLKQLETL